MMRRLLARAVVTIAAAAAVAVPAGAAQATGSTPGTYTNYSFAGGGTLSEVTFGITVRSDPGRGNVFWSNQFGFSNGVGGYLGMQRHRDGGGMFLFSLWDATGGTPGGSGTYCQTFSEGGSGYTCRLDRAFVAGHHYTYRIAPGASGWYTATIADVTAGTSFVLGSLQVGAGATIDTGGMVDWVEYFDWNNSAATCADEPYSAAFFDLPTGLRSGSRVTATVSGTSVSSTCASASSVTPQTGGSLQRDAIGNSSSGSITGIGGRCVDITGGSSADGTPIELWSCTGGNNQNWVRASDGTVHALFRCLTANGTGNGAPVVLSSCTGGAGQQWTASNGALVNPASGRCLDATGGSSAAGTKLELWTCTGAANQAWTLPS
jgi:hypothetical protein